MAHHAFFLFLLAYLLQEISMTDAKVPAIIVFGDSTVDSGNNNQISTILKSNFEPYGRDFRDGKPTGRFSNGRIPTDFISEAFGIKDTVPAYLDPAYNITDFATGVCFASAGTGYDTETSNVLAVIPLQKELEYYKEYQSKLRSYLGNERANEIISEALYVISLGTNDFLENYYALPVRSAEYSVKEYQGFLVEIARRFIKDIYKLGARKISLGGLPPMGCLPLERATNFFFGGDCITEYNDVAKEFNTKLEELLPSLSQELDGIHLVFSDPYDIVEAIIEKPDSFGFQNVEIACCGTGHFEMSYLCDSMNPFTCSNANEYMFWDSFHPTEKTNNIVADHVFHKSLSQFL